MEENPISSAVLEWSGHLELFFQWWETTSAGAYIGTIVFVFVYSAGYEALTYSIQRITSKYFFDKSIILPVTTIVNIPPSRWQEETYHILHCLLFLLHITWGYSIMIALMSLNGGVFITIILGRTLCHYIIQRRTRIYYMSRELPEVIDASSEPSPDHH